MNLSAIYQNGLDHLYDLGPCIQSQVALRNAIELVRTANEALEDSRMRRSCLFDGHVPVSGLARLHEHES